MKPELHTMQYYEFSFLLSYLRKSYPNEDWTTFFLDELENLERGSLMNIPTADIFDDYPKIASILEAEFGEEINIDSNR